MGIGPARPGRPGRQTERVGQHPKRAVPQRNWQARLSLLLVLMLLGGALGNVAPAALAQSDPCPEPNEAQAAACDLQSDAPVQGVIDSPEDIDGYRVVLTVGDRSD